MPTHHGGRHEHGQNFLTDGAVIARVVDLTRRTDGPIVEIGPGAGALTEPLLRLGRPLTAVEIDRRHAGRMRRALPAATVVHGDFLQHRLPTEPHAVVGNLPFHLTTAVLRKLLHAQHWTGAVLIVQWEVARRRAGVGGATMMTAQWSPWYEFGLAGRIPAAAFTPRPAVDAGLLTITRRRTPLVPTAQRRTYAAFVHAVFTGRGRGLPEILAGVAPRHRRAEARRWAVGRGARLPRDLRTEDWTEAFARFA
ncbi:MULTISPECIES: 23S ribosomal RNA methyltransferase Erm [Tsukamurella]|uniref:23S ribosomal RNA methyltransferase Erm n=2 Tax=Tsukamurella TaxID=2060 RepID=A0A5C5S486_9ACTN|nr:MULTISPECIES: 23S ribosomal RNA methyltransferase Erm [Tsukamurella]NMD56833.1 23S ribosomal RNA methyltransferase Erm [Tsukamurella columbiensis]TWS29742.1 23S ribosomal RNA methyltransferase Erm [Tsukamurella conjunctivitidis]